MRSSQPDRRRKTARPTRVAQAAPIDDAGRRAAGGDRRSRERLRELCDEVLASYRAATEGESLSVAERADAEALLARVAPLPRD